MKHTDEYFMNKAFIEAKKASFIDEVPIGAIIVKDNKIIARGHNERETKQDVTMHAEIIAIKKACKKLKSWRLINCKLYVTIEPCLMCASAIYQARIEEVIFGGDDTKAGAFGGAFNLLDCDFLNHYPNVKKGIMKEECSKLVSNFFKGKRKK